MRLSRRFTPDHLLRWSTGLAFNDISALALALCLAACALVLTSSLPIWRVYNWAPASLHGADRIRITAALAGPYASTSPDVLLLGGSQARELLPSDDFVSAALSDTCGKSVNMLNAGSSAQSSELQIQLLNWWVKSPRLVVIAVTPWRLLKPAQATRPAVAALLPLANQRTPWRERLWVPAIGVATALDIALVRQRPESNTPFDTWQHHYTAPGWDGPSRLADALFEVSLTLSATRADLEANRMSLVTLAQQIHDGGGQAVFLTMPSAPEARPAYSRVESGFRAALVELGQVAPVLEADPNLVPSEGFFDAVHLLPSGRAAAWPVLRRLLATHVPGCRLS